MRYFGDLFNGKHFVILESSTIWLDCKTIVEQPLASVAAT